MRRAILRSMTMVGSKSLTSAAMRTSKPVASKLGDGPAAADAGDEVAPERGMVVADGRDGAESGDHGATGEVLLRHGRLHSWDGVPDRTARRGRMPRRRGPLGVAARACGMARHARRHEVRPTGG